MTAIAVDNLVKEFGDKRAVDGVGFTTGESELLVLVGPSGCGKTTTLRMLAGLEPVSSGTIRFGDREVTDVRPRDRSIAMVFQDYAILPHLTVFENIAYGLRSRRTPRAVVKDKVPEAARTFRIDHLLDRKPRQLSGGERQRVALSRSMVRDADLYLYDEPLSNLDAQLRYSAREDILTLHRRKKRPTIYVTHDQSEAMALGDRIAVMNAGRIQQIGTGEELYERPVNRFVAFFIGTPSINLFTMELKNVDGDMVASGCGLDLRLPESIAHRIRAYAGRKIELGVRPEHLHVPRMAPFDVTEDNTIHGVVTVIEPSATGSTVYLSTPEEAGAEPQDFTATFKVRMPASYLDQEVPLGIDLEKVHLFDAETGDSLLHGPQGKG
ncbi:ABC transporter ATP-binding protein [Streptomyces jeddahensis]|uniref:sn-glycerol-3-phosphate import ATP-binding protein UgpC n=1 Tax=Streptomyces jeddahensis TaxID=1716141 RepID=A0A177HNZ2_9ACTN|nr:ABC transporter ATP-binding protein [Streptomyces jeddahensis]OAH12329.1 sn-glycerol-3-phosphate import ATP-binding protein UgpC [Streptomyces jeddahensis]